MKKLLLLVASILAPTLASGGQFKIGDYTYTVPDGFEVTQAAGAPLVNRPICASFDERGRLYIADSSGSNEKPDKQLLNPTHRIVRLEDTVGDGRRFDSATLFADKMMFPEGAMWFNGALYVGAPPSIWKLADTDGDGRADQREEWFQGKTLTGCANDLHGPYLGPDGWIYWCKGAFATQTHERPGKAPFKTRAAHIFRSQPNGKGIEPVMTGGMDNPVEVAFMPSGERIFTTTFLQNPGGGNRDGLIHAIYGGLYGKVNDVLDDHPRTGELMPVLSHMGAAAPSGLMRYESKTFGADFQDNLFACQFNKRKVSRHVLTPDGATFKSVDSDFLTSDNPDFHPTDVLEDADGSLIVLNTGGWYKLCCPTSQLAKPDVLGAVLRVRRIGAPRMEDPRGLLINWAGLSEERAEKLLDDPRPSVRNRAIATVSEKQWANVAERVIKNSSSAQARLNAIWALVRLGAGEDAPRGKLHEAVRRALNSGLNDKDLAVRLAALHSVALWRDHQALPQLLKLLEDKEPRVKRAAAEALGRIGDKSAVPALLAAAVPAKGAQPNDRVLEHSVIFALIEIADQEGTSAGLKDPDPRAQRAALIALDQMPNGQLRPESVTPLLASANPLLKETATWIVSRHNNWGSALAGSFKERLYSTKSSPSDQADLQKQLNQFAREPEIQQFFAATLRDEKLPSRSRVAILAAIGQAGLKETPAALTAEVTKALASGDAAVLNQAVSTARSLSPKEGAAEFSAALLKLARNHALTEKLRLDALAALPGGLNPVDADLFALLLKNLEPGQPVSMRGAASSVLAKAKLAPGQLGDLAAALKNAGPLELVKALGAFEGASDETLGLNLLAALKDSKGASALRAETLKPRLAKFPASVQTKADELLLSLNADAAKQKSHLEEVLGQLKGGDIRRGQAIFNSAKAACASCHAIGYLGGKVGPDLTSIGQIRTERDLLESIIYPSASFVRSYEPMIVTTKAGEEFSGVLKKDASDEVVLATGPETEARIPRADITEMRLGAVSIMPQGLDQQLAVTELADLVAFLKNTRWGPQ